VASALGGALHVTATPKIRRCGSPAAAGVTASLAAAAGTLIALRHASRTGRGQRVDVSLLEAVVSRRTSAASANARRRHRATAERHGLFASVPSGTYPCRDGLVYVMVNRPRHWQALAAWIAR